MYLLAYRSSKHKTTGATPSEMYLGDNLRLPLDLLRGRLPSEEADNGEGTYVGELKKKLEIVHFLARRRLKLKAGSAKTWYDRRARKILFEPGEKVWLHNPCRVVGRAPKLQSSWEGPYEVLRRLSDVVFCVRRSANHRSKVVHADRLAPFLTRSLSS